MGVYDLAGNVWEWCADRYATRLRDLPDDGSPYRDGNLGRVLRGGSWRRTLELARVSSRTWQDDDYVADDVGMRCVVDAATSSPSAVVGELANRVWPVRSDPSRPLAGADLDTQDRMYLERRAMTWLVLEARYDLAFPRATALLADGIAVDVARDVFERAERRMLELAAEGRTDELLPVLLVYRDVAGAGREMDERRRRFLQRVIRILRAAGQQLLDSGDLDGAGRHFRLALRLAPDDALLERSYRRTRPRPGSVIVWPEDDREMVWIPAGEQRVGASVGDPDAEANEHPARLVRLEGFWLDRREVTNDDYRRCVASGACTPPSNRVAFDDPNQGDHPVLSVDWYQARSYARWAGKRLPSETEWERAARAGAATPYPWGLVWVDGRCNAIGAVGTDRWGASAPVASFPANAWNVYDMLGNAAEWVADLYDGLEDEYGIQMSDDEANTEAFNTVDSIASLVQKKLRRVRGGAEAITPPQFVGLAGRTFAVNETLRTREKQAIARAAEMTSRENGAAVQTWEPEA